MKPIEKEAKKLSDEIEDSLIGCYFGATLIVGCLIFFILVMFFPNPQNELSTLVKIISGMLFVASVEIGLPRVIRWVRAVKAIYEFIDRHKRK